MRRLVGHNTEWRGLVRSGCLTDPSLSGSATWDVTFTQPGMYAYHCAIHEQMTGTITVH